jgi:hypothetical protein
MLALRKSRLSAAVISLALWSACSSSNYKIIDMDRGRTELQVSPNRILLECEDIEDHTNAGDPEGSFGFMLHILDEENTVVTAIEEPVTTRKYCFERLNKIDRIIKNGKSVYIGAHHALDVPRIKEARSYLFGKKGPYFGNGRTLQLSVIKNEQGQCYTAHSGDNEPCMPPEFPIKNSPRR